MGLLFCLVLAESGPLLSGTQCLYPIYNQTIDNVYVYVYLCENLGSQCVYEYVDNLYHHDITAIIAHSYHPQCNGLKAHQQQHEEKLTGFPHVHIPLLIRQDVRRFGWHESLIWG